MEFGRVSQATPGLQPADFAQRQLPVSLHSFEMLLGLRLVGGGGLAAGWDVAARLDWAPATTSVEAGEGAGVGTGARQGGAEGVESSAATPAASFLTTELLLQELLVGCKKLVGPFVAMGTAARPPNGPGDTSSWMYAGGPATLAHLVSLAAPQQVRPRSLQEPFLCFFEPCVGGTSCTPGVCC